MEKKNIQWKLNNMVQQSSTNIEILFNCIEFLQHIVCHKAIDPILEFFCLKTVTQNSWELKAGLINHG